MAKTREKAEPGPADLSEAEAKALAAWHDSQEKKDVAESRRWTYYMCSFVGALALLVFVIATGSYVLEPRPAGSKEADQRNLAIVLSLFGLIISAAFAWIARFRYRYHERQFRERVEIGVAALERKHALDKVTDDLSLGNLFTLNRTESDEYHVITRAQAAQSFRNAQIAMFFGFGLISVGIVAVLLPTSPEVKIAVGVISLIGGTVGGYVNRTFLKAHSLSIVQLNKLFRQPLVQSYLLTAERIAMQLEPPNERLVVLRSLIEQTVRAAEAAGRTDDESGTAARQSNQSSSRIGAGRSDSNEGQQ
jgi:hypothetical protein